MWAYFSNICAYAGLLSVVGLCVQLMCHGPTAVDAFKTNHYLQIKCMLDPISKQRNIISILIHKVALLIFSNT